MTKKTKKIRHIKYFEAPFLGNNFLYAIVSRPEEIKEAEEIHDMPEFEKDTAAICHLFEPSASAKVCIIHMPRELQFIDPHGSIALLTHEITHLKQFFIDHINEASPSHEFEAYLMQEFMHNLLPNYMIFNDPS